MNKEQKLKEKMDTVQPSQMGENNNNAARMLPPRTPNYGKTPKYINKYKEEQKQSEVMKEEMRMAKLRPPGTK